MLPGMKPGLAQVRDTQFGVFTGWQVLCEYSRAEMREHIDRGQWVRVFRGVYREAATEPTARLRVEAARLSLGEPGLVAAYGTAARLHGLPVPDDPVTHVLGARPTRSPRLIVHSDLFDEREVEIVTGTAATGLVRTAVDTARTLGRADALAVVEAVLARDISPAALFVELEAQRGRRGRAQADELVELAIARAGSVFTGDDHAVAAEPVPIRARVAAKVPACAGLRPEGAAGRGRLTLRHDRGPARCALDPAARSRAVAAAGRAR